MNITRLFSLLYVNSYLLNRVIFYLLKFSPPVAFSNSSKKSFMSSSSSSSSTSLFLLSAASSSRLSEVDELLSLVKFSPPVCCSNWSKKSCLLSSPFADDACICDPPGKIQLVPAGRSFCAFPTRNREFFRALFEVDELHG